MFARNYARLFNNNETSIVCEEEDEDEEEEGGREEEILCALRSSPPRILFTGAANAISVGSNKDFDWSRNEGFIVRLRLNKAGTYGYSQS